MSDTGPATARRTLKYSLLWAERVLRSFYGKHPRAPEFLNKYLGLSDRQLGILLASGDSSWEVCRDMAKVWDNWHRAQERSGIAHAGGEAWAMRIIRMYVSRAKHSLSEYLTGILESSHNGVVEQ